MRDTNDPKSPPMVRPAPVDPRDPSPDGRSPGDPPSCSGSDLRAEACAAARANVASALRTLRRLRDGLDPADAAPLAPDHPFQRPEVLRALFVATSAVELLAAADDAGRPGPLPPRGAERPKPANRGMPWSAEDDRLLAEAFDAGDSIAEIAETFGRSRGSIRARLLRLGRGEFGGPPPRWPVGGVASGSAAADPAAAGRAGAGRSEPVPTLEPEPV